MQDSQSEGMRQAFLDVTCADFGVVQIRAGVEDIMYRTECQGCTGGWRSHAEVVGTKRKNAVKLPSVRRGGFYGVFRMSR